MQLLVEAGQPVGRRLTEGELDELYRPPARDRPWLRVNMVASIDGAATGANDKSGSLNNAIDRMVFHLLRDQADAIIVGAGTARAERYRPAVAPLVVISRSGVLPARLAERARPWATSLTKTDLAGSEVVLSAVKPDLLELVASLQAAGCANLLCEGGPALFGDLLRLGLVDELCQTISPLLIGGDNLRIVTGAPLLISAELHTLIAADSTLLSRWTVGRR